MRKYGDTGQPVIPVIPIAQVGIDRWLPWRRPFWMTTEPGVILGRFIPAGTVFNGASIPWPVNMFYSPGRSFFYPALLHDLECGEHTKEQLVSWVTAADRFLEAMSLYGTPRIRRYIFYFSVQMNGMLKGKD